MDGSGYDEYWELDKGILAKRLDKVDFWIKASRTLYPYGLNQCKRKSSNYATIGSLYFTTKRYRQQNWRCRNRRNH